MDTQKGHKDNYCYGPDDQPYIKAVGGTQSHRESIRQPVPNLDTSEADIHEAMRDHAK